MESINDKSVTASSGSGSELPQIKRVTPLQMRTYSNACMPCTPCYPDSSGPCSPCSPCFPDQGGIARLALLAIRIQADRVRLVRRVFPTKAGLVCRVLRAILIPERSSPIWITSIDNCGNAFKRIPAFFIARIAENDRRFYKIYVVF